MRLAVREDLVPGKAFSEKLAEIEEYGFEGVEIRGKNIIEMAREVKSALASSNVKFSTVCGHPGDLLGPDKKTRETAIDGIVELLRICADLGGIGVITVPTFGGPKISDLYPWHPDILEIEREIVIEEYRILGRYAEDLDTFIIMEPLNRYETHFVRNLQQSVEICEAVRMEHVKMMADFFHMNIEEASITESLEKAADHIVHIHLADSNRLLPGCGHIDFKEGIETLKKIGYKNFMALECKAPDDPNVELPKCASYLKQFI